MAKRRKFHVLVGTDGSTQAQAAVMTALGFPWSRHAEARGVVALGRRTFPGLSRAGASALEPVARHVAGSLRRGLARRWPQADVRTIDAPAVEAILGEARRFAADVIVLGWRGHGPLRRLLMGSVSRDVVRRAPCAVLVVRRRPGEIRRFVIGFDGSVSARRAVALVAGLDAPRGGRVTVVGVVEPAILPTAPLLPGPVRAAVRREAAALHAERLGAARRGLKAAVARLERGGWRAQPDLRVGAPLVELLDAVRRTRADVLVVGTRAVHGVERALLGSVAEGALNRSPVPILVVR